VTKSQLDLLRGTLDMLVLKALDQHPMHGYDIARMIEVSTEDVLRVEEGSLYPALHRMERRGWIAATWGRSENNRRAKFYELTDLGREQLELESAEWKRYTDAVEQMMRKS
jgi:PadR family transcriptional regulator PadR